MLNSVSQFSSMSTRKGMSGLISNMDTDALIEGLTAGTRTKITTQLQKKQLTQWKQEAYRTVINEANAFQKKYLSYNSGKNSILSPSFFKATSISNTSKFVKVSGSETAAKNIIINDILSLAETSKLSTSHNLSSQKITSGVIDEKWDASTVSGSTVRIKYGDDQYDVKIPSSFSFPNKADGTPLTNDEKIDAVIASLNTSIDGNDDLKGKVSFSYVAGTGVTLTSTDKNVTITDGTEKLLQGLGFNNLNNLPKDQTTITGGGVDASKMYETKTLKDSLSGTSLTVEFNGVSKTITFLASEVADYSTPADLKDYLQSKIDTAYGSGKVKVDIGNLNSTGGGSITFEADPSMPGYKNSIFTLKSGDASVLGVNGALKIATGTSNRVLWNQSLDTLASQLNGVLTKDAVSGKYEVEINSIKFEFDGTQSLSDVFNKINSSAAGVTLSYSTTSDTISVTAKDSGSVGRVAVASSGTSSLASVLFGSNANISVTQGSDAILNVSFDGGKTSSTVIRSSNTFSLDGLNIELLGKADNPAINFAGSSIELEHDGNAYTLALPADFKIDDAFDYSKKAWAMLDGLNEQIANTPGLAGKAEFTVTNGKIELKSLDGNAMTVTGGSQALLNGLGFVVGDTGTSITNTNIPAIETTVQEKISFGVEHDTDELVKKIQTFFEDYNKVIKLANDLVREQKSTDNKNKYDPLTDEQKKDMTEDEIKAWEEKAKKGILSNDTYLYGFLSGMREAMTNPVDDLGLALSTFGIKSADWKENGQFTVDEEVLRKALANNPEGLSDIFTRVSGEGTSKEEIQKSGIATRLQHMLNGSTGTTGEGGYLVAIAGKDGTTYAQDTLSREIRSIDRRLDELKDKLKAEEEMHFKKFAYMEQYLNQMNQQSAWLSQQFGG